MILICNLCGGTYNTDEHQWCPYCSEVDLEYEHPIPLRGLTNECIIMDDVAFEDTSMKDSDQ